MKKSFILLFLCAILSLNSIAQVGPILGSLSGCPGSTTTLFDTTAGGLWFSSTPGVASIGSATGMVTAITTGTTTISYVTGGGTATAVYTVNPAPAPITGISTVCLGATTTLANATPGGLWTSAAPPIATVGITTGIVTGNSLGTTTISYTVGAGCSVYKIVTVNAIPSPLVGPDRICVGATATYSSLTSGGFWSISPASVATVSSLSMIVTGVSPGTATLMYTVGGCHTNKIISVNAVPIISGSGIVCVGASATLVATPPGGTWISSSPAVVSVDTFTGVISGVAAGTASIYYSAGGCSTFTTVSVYPTPPPIGGSSTICAGSSSLLTNAATGGIWTSSSLAIATVGSATGMVTGISPGTTTITYTLPTGCIRTIVVTVISGSAVISGTTSICVGSSASWVATPPGGIWSSSAPTIASIGSSGVVTGLSVGTSTISYSISGCVSTKIVSVNPGPAPIMGPDTICVGGFATMGATPSGGTWSCSTPLVATISLSGIVTGVSPGVAVLTYTLPSGCFATKTIFVTSGSAGISGSSSVCVGGTITMVATPPGGVWSSSTTAIATIGSAGLVTGVSPGVVTISYSLGGCTSTKTVSVTASPIISGSSSVCVGSSITLSATPPGGVWVSSATGVATIGSTGIVTGIATGTTMISYYVGGCVTTKIVSVNAGPLAITGPSTLCVGSVITLSCTPGGGAWSGSNPAVASVSTATGVVSGISAGTAVITYTLAGGCFTTTTVTVTSGAIISGSSTVCVGATTTLMATPPGGVWISSVTGVATIGSTGIVTGIAPGTTMISYYASGCVTTKIVSVNAGPSATTGPSTVCAGSVITLANATPGGAWSSSNAAVASVTTATGVVSGISAGTAVITYTLAGGCFTTTTVTVTSGAIISGSSTVCVGSTTVLMATPPGGVWISSSTAIATVGSTGIVTGVTSGVVTISYYLSGCVATKIISVSPGPAPIVGNSFVCVGSAIVLTDATPGGLWSSSNPAVATVGSSTGYVIGIAPGVVNITYSTGSSCSVVKSVTVNSVLSPITGSSIVCVGATIALSNATSGGTWTSSNPTRATVNSTTGVVTGIAPGVVTIYYVAGGCGANKTISVNASPAAISGSSAVCVGSNITLTNATTGGTWSSSNTSIATIGLTSGVITGISAGVVTITYTKAGCSSYKTVSVNAAPGPISGGGSVCVGSSITLTNSAAGGTWSSSNTSRATVGASTGVVTGVSVGTVIIYYSTGCGATYTIVSVIAAPAAITGSSSVCVGSAITLSNTTPGGSWLSGNTSIATVGSSTGIVTGVTPGVVNIYYSIGGCGASITISVNAAPAPITGGSSVCAGSTLALSDATPGGTWSSSNTSIATVNTAGVVTGVAPGGVVITYTVGGCFTVKTVSVITGPVISGLSTMCVGSSITLVATPPGGMWSSSLPTVAYVDSAGVVYGLTTGIVSITYSIGGCSTVRIISVNPAPSPIIGGSSVCTGSTLALSDAIPGGTWSSSNTSIATVNTAGVVTGVAPGGVVITYTVGGCFVVKTISITAGPVVSGSSSLCVGSSTTFVATPAGGMWSSSNPSVAVVGSTGLVFGVAPGVASITYTIGGCSTVKIVSVNAVPSPIIGSTNLCVGSSTTLTNATPGGTWSSSNTSVATVSASGVVTGISSGVVIITYSIGGCLTIKTMVINAAPVVSGASSICVGSSTTFVATPSGGMWSSSNPSVAVVGSTGLVTGVAPGIVSIAYTIGACSASITISINAAPAPITGGSSVCAGSTLALASTTPGGIWSSSNTSIAIVNTTGVVTGIAPGGVIITYSVGGCFVIRTVSVTTGPVIGGVGSLCVGSSLTLVATPPGGIWSSSSSSVAVAGSTGMVFGLAPGMASITYTVGGCSAVTIISVNAAPAPITGGSSVCTGSTLALSDVTPGGTWSSSNTSIATVNAAGVVTGVSAGGVIITYSVGGCFVVKTVGVSTGPMMTGASSLCVGSSVSLFATPSGGVWSSSAPGIAFVGTTGLVTGLAPGVVSITYSLGSCSAIRVLSVNATPLPIVGGGGMCSGSTITLTNAVAGGMWTSSLPAVATVASGTGVVTGVSSGVTTITYAIGSCATSTTVTVYTMPAPIAGVSSLCVGSTTTLTNAVPGGTWISTPASVATIGITSGLVTGVSAGVVFVTYSIGTCTAIKKITVVACSGIVSGKISTGAAKGTSDAVPVPGMMVKIKDATTNSEIAQTVTGGDGKYSFTGLGDGNYYVYPESVGYTTTQSGAMDVSENTSKFANVDFYVNEGDKIISQGLSTGIDQLGGNAQFNIFPNPASGTISIAWENQLIGNAVIVVTDVVGREVVRTAVNNGATSGTVQLNLSELKDGMYMLTIKSEQVNYNTQILIRK